MPTIANLPGADVQVQFPSGTIKTVNMIRLLAQVQNAEFKRDHDMFLPGLNKLRPTVKALREEYEMPPSIKTWAQAAAALRRFHGDLTAHIQEHRVS